MLRIRKFGNRPAESITMICVVVIASLSACALPGPQVRAKVVSGDALNEDTSSFYARGKIDLANARFGLAVRNFGLALSRNPGSVETLNALAVSYDRLDRYDLAMRYYGKALRIDPDSVQTINNIAYSYYRRGEAELAANILAKIGGPASTDPVVAGNYRLARAAMNSRHHRCRAGGEDASDPPSAPRPDGDRPQRKLRIVPIGSGLQRLVMEADLEHRPAKTASGKSAATTRAADRTLDPHPAAGAGARLASAQAACSALTGISIPAPDATDAREPSLDRRPGAEPTAARHSEIELPVDLDPELIDLEPELLGPIGSDYHNEST